MGGVCERPGCSRPASAAVALDPRNRVVWVGDLEGSGTSVNRLCTTCADALTAPRGWDQRDVRETPRLFAIPNSPDDEPPKRRKRTRRPPADPATNAANATNAEPAGLAMAVGQNEPTTAALPTAAPESSLGELHRGDAAVSPAAAALLAPGSSTPLLARAFRAARAG